jgi:hypothetical protein
MERRERNREPEARSQEKGKGERSQESKGVLL